MVMVMAHHCFKLTATRFKSSTLTAVSSIAPHMWGSMEEVFIFKTMRLTEFILQIVNFFLMNIRFHNQGYQVMFWLYWTWHLIRLTIFDFCYNFKPKLYFSDFSRFIKIWQTIVICHKKNSSTFATERHFLHSHLFSSKEI